MELPAQFGKYLLERFLGGGMSHVFQATDTVLNRTVCVKILTPEGAADEDTRARFLAEAKMSASLVHDNVIRIFDYGQELGHPYIVMEFLTGSDLRSAIRSNTTGDLADRLNIAIQGAKALEYVHSKKLIHRDIKPDNLHIDLSGRVRLMDFGIAKSQDLHLTKTGFQVGTPYYMSPEQVMGEPATERVDIYAYGILLYELFTGVRPIEGETVERLFYQILHEPLKLDALLAAQLPQPLVSLIVRMTAKKPEDRPATFGEVIRALEGGAPAEPEPVHSGKKVTGLMLAFALVVVAGFIGLTMWKLDAIRTSVAVRSSPEPIIKSPAGDLVIVPKGEFLAGEDRHKAELPAFYIDKTEVTNAAYAVFAQEKNRPVPTAAPDLPVVNVATIEAKDFCAWAGKRLPTPLEWEKAARGSDGRIYPWGNDPDPDKAVTDNKPLAPANSLQGAGSPYGVMNLAGNVWEWVDETRSPSEGAVNALAAVLNPPPTATEPWYAAKGGSFDRPIAHAVAYEFITLPARMTAPNVGFRCAKDAPPQAP
jgi:serine/threonine-protein kinase